MPPRTLALATTVTALAASLAIGRAGAARDYFLELSPETETARTLRHDQIALRRSGPVVMVHRGASALAPENTLLAYARAMDCGADGVEVDVRRTADGVLVLFHDDVLDRLTHGIGAVNQLPARALLTLKPRSAFGRPLGGTPPSFVQLLELARQRAMLLHLDLKEDGLESEVARWLEAVDGWDHVVSVNTAHATNLVADPRLRPLRYKVPGLYAQRQDVDPTAVEQALRQPGEMLLVDDPRVAARVLGRKPYAPVVLSQTFRYSRPDNAVPRGAGHGEFNASAHLAALTLRVAPDSAPQLLAILEAPEPARDTDRSGPPAVPTDNGRVDDADRPQAARIVERAWAADRLGQLGRKSRAVVRALERLVETPLPHRDWRYDGLDGGLAARALGQLAANESAGVLIAAFRRGFSSPDAATMSDENPSSRRWAEARFRLHIMAALGDLRCRAARRFLLNHLALNEAAANAFGSPCFEEATRALLRQNLAWDGIARLLRHSNPLVRGTAMIECLDWPNEERRQALTAACGWAMSLPRVPYGELVPRVRADRVRPSVAAPPKHAP